MTDSEKSQITFSCTRVGRSGKFAISFNFEGGGSFVRQIALADAGAREKLADELCESHGGIDRDMLLAELENEAAAEFHEQGDTGSAGSQTDRLVDLVEATSNIELFHDGQGRAYATLPRGDHLETWRVQSKAFKDWLAFKSYSELQKAAPSQALHDACSTIAGKARFASPECAVYLRVAGLSDCIWLDLCDDDWRAVRIDANGWRVVNSVDVQVKFVRRKGMLPLPEPQRGGSIEQLRPLVNLPDDDSWTLAIGWMLGAFRPDGPYGVLSVSGEQGSAKSTTCKLLRGLIDPNQAPLRRPPRSERDLFIAGGNSWLCGFNNLSGLRPDLSDALCALATDGGFATRQLFADEDETIFSARRPVMLNGIEDPATRSDLVDRAILLHLPRITEDCYRSESEINEEFERVRPLVLGAILTAVSAALRNQASVELTRRPRMVDLAVWVTAGEEAFGWERGRFLDAYFGNRSEAHVSVVESSAIGPAILSLVATKPWDGTMGELLIALNERNGDAKPPADWPKNGRGMGAALRRLAPNLRQMGVSVEFSENPVGRAKRRTVRIEKVGTQRSASSASSANGSSQSPAKGDEDVDADHADHCVRTLSEVGGEPGSTEDRPVRRLANGPPHRHASPPGACPMCRRTRFWRTRGSGEGTLLTCGACHPPKIASVEWVTDPHAPNDVDGTYREQVP